MNRTKIEWADYTWNPITGCSRGCSYCYARRMAYRLKGRAGYPENDPFVPTFHPDRLLEPFTLQKSAKIFTCSMGEFFDEAVDNIWRSIIFHTMSWTPQHAFLILTKQLCRAVDMLDCTRLGRETPKNLWLGISQDGKTTDASDIEWLRKLPRELIRFRFISFEPLLGEIRDFNLEGIDWIIIGAQTGAGAKQPKTEWIEPIINNAQINDVPLFIKNNLDISQCEIPRYWREFPEAMNRR